MTRKRFKEPRKFNWLFLFVVSWTLNFWTFVVSGVGSMLHGHVGPVTSVSGPILAIMTAILATLVISAIRKDVADERAERAMVA